MTTTARSIIKQDALTKLIRLLSPFTRGITFPLTTTSGGSTTTLRDTRLNRRSPGTSDYDGMTIEIIEKVGSGPEIGEIATVTAYDGTDQLTFTPALSGTVETGTDYLIYPPDIEPEAFNQNLDAIQRNTEAPYLHFPSMVPDAELLLTGSWAEVTTSTTLTLTTAAEDMVLGESGLKIITSVTGEGRESAAFGVNPQDSLQLMVYARAESGDFKIQLWDATNDALIEESGTIDIFVPVEVRFSGEIPATCRKVQVRVVCVTAVSDIRVAGPFVVQSLKGTNYHGPTWLTRWAQVNRAVVIPSGYGLTPEFAYAGLTEGLASARLPGYVQNARAANPFTLTFPTSSGFPLALECSRAPDEFASATATTPLDREYMMWRLCANVLMELGDENWVIYAKEAVSLAGYMGYGIEERIIEANPRTRV